MAAHNPKQRLSQQAIEDNVASEHYFTAEDGVGRANRWHTSNGGKDPASLSRLTFCVLVLKDGFTVTGESRCFNPVVFDAALGCQYARKKALKKLSGFVTNGSAPEQTGQP